MIHSPMEYGLAVIIFICEFSRYWVWNIHEVDFFHHSLTHLHTSANNLSSLTPSFHHIWMTKTQTWMSLYFFPWPSQTAELFWRDLHNRSDGRCDKVTLWASRFPGHPRIPVTNSSPPLATTPQSYPILVKLLTPSLVWHLHHAALLNQQIESLRMGAISTLPVHKREQPRH